MNDVAFIIEFTKTRLQKEVGTQQHFGNILSAMRADYTYQFSTTFPFLAKEVRETLQNEGFVVVKGFLFDYKIFPKMKRVQKPKVKEEPKRIEKLPKKRQVVLKKQKIEAVPKSQMIRKNMVTNIYKKKQNIKPQTKLNDDFSNLFVRTIGKSEKDCGEGFDKSIASIRALIDKRKGIK